MDFQSQPSHIISFPRAQARLILWSAVLTCVCVGGTLSLPFWYGLGLYYAPATIHEVLKGYLSLDLLIAFWLPSIGLGGLIWGLALARLTGIRPVWRLSFAGGLGVLLGGVVATSTPFPRLFSVLWPQAPVHIRWIMNMVLGVGLGGGIAALALGLTVRWARSAVMLALGVALASALLALVVALGLDAIGIRWGAGNANMAKVVGLAFPVSTVAAGALIGRYLARMDYQL